jgi:hypothetical protein
MGEAIMNRVDNPHEPVVTVDELIAYLVEVRDHHPGQSIKVWIKTDTGSTPPIVSARVEQDGKTEVYIV